MKNTTFTCKYFTIILFLFLESISGLQAQWNQIGNNLIGQNEEDYFGSSVSLSADGNTLAVGAPEHDLGSGNYGNASDAGRVYVYTKNGANWVQKGMALDGVKKDGFFGSQVCLSDDGNIIAIKRGYFYGVVSGDVRVYSWNGIDWQQMGTTIFGPDKVSSIDISADGKTILLGQAFADWSTGISSFFQVGIAKVVHWNGWEWEDKGTQLVGDASTDRFGTSVGISDDGNTIIVGSPTDHGANAMPNVKVYHWSGSNWIKKGATIYGGSDTGERVSLSSDGNTFAVGAPLVNKNNLTQVGRIRVYSWNGSSWIQKGNDIFGQVNYDQYGGYPISLSSDGDKLAVSRAYGYYDTIVNVGYVRMYYWDAQDSIWVRKGNDILGEYPGDYTGTGLAFNKNATIIAIGTPNYNDNGRVQVFRGEGVYGTIFQDFNTNCSQENSEHGIAYKNLTINPGNIQLQTNSDGFWSLGSLTVGSYTLTVDTSGGWLTTCPNPIVFNITNTETLSEIPPIGMLSKFPCTAPSVSIHAPFLRPGFSNQYVYVQAANRYISTQILENAYVILDVPPLLTIDTASLPYTLLGNNHYRVHIADSLYPGESVNFWLSCTLASNAVLGQSLCMSAQLYPIEPCVLGTNPSNIAIPCSTNYDNSDLVVSSTCLNNDSISFDITNVGTGNMFCSSQIRLFIDGQIAKIDNVQLLSLETINFSFSGNGQTWRLETDQHPLHPNSLHPSKTVEGCGHGSTFTSNLVNLFPQDDAVPFVDIYCGEVRGSYDPNDKTGFPLGVGSAHDILPNQKLEYLIRFQNTGTDTAFNVIIKDTLSKDFNIFSIKSGISSHHYSFKVSGPNVLEWTFSNIMLPDSNANEPQSHGFVKFEVDLIPNLQEGHVIENTAFIYFDYNAPIITNTYFHTINSGIQQFKSPSNNYSSDPLIINTFPNPIKDYVYINLCNNDYVDLKILDNLGKIVYQKQLKNPIESINLSNLAVGIYYFYMSNGQQCVTQKIIKQ